MLLMEGVTAGSGPEPALSGLDLAVRRGECFGVEVVDEPSRHLIVALVTGRVAPVAGRVRIDGLDPLVHAGELDGVVRVVVATDGRAPTASHRAVANLARDPGVRLWVLDGPSDRAGGRALVDLLATARREPPATVLVVSHEPDLLAATCGRVVRVPAVHPARPERP